jgi:undecaprenyl-diphosphatase
VSAVTRPATVLASIFSVTQNLGLPVLALFVAVEALGVPIPGETAVIFAGLAANQGRLSIVAVIVVASAAAIVGDNIGFLIGRRGGRALLERPGRFETERRRVLAIGDPFFERHGPKAVFLGRWITGLRVWTSWLAGASDMRWPTFLVWNALGGTAWATSVALAAYYGGKGVEHVFSQIGLYGIPVAVAVFALFALWWWRRRRARSVGEDTEAGAG